jgi:MFS transporter, PAT family, beta-lactamase induction signal transducer AmpG
MADLTKNKVSYRNPWAWVPSLYFAQGIPYVIVMFVTVVMYRRLGISNTEIALYTSWLYLPWVIKPLWSPIVDLLKTKRYWIIITQLVVGAGLGSVALTIPLPDFFKITIAIFWLMAFASATHDIAADGFYMLSLSKHQQAWFVGVRSTFYRLAMITGQGLLIIIAGTIESKTGLDDVDIIVTARPDIEHTQLPSPADIDITPLPGEVRVIALPERPELSTRTRSKAEVDSVLQFAREWNIRHGFNPVDIKNEKATQAAAAGDEPGWWSKHITQNIEGFLRRNFAPREEPALDLDYAGNIGIVFFHLSGEPEEDEMVLTFGRVRGDHSISLVEGERIVYTKENWNIPAVAVIKLDPQLDFATSATFQVRSGNIPLAWSITFFFLAGLFLLFFVYHKFILPYPEADKGAAGNGGKSISKEFFRTFALFFRKERIGIAIAFLLLYRFAEAQLVRLASPFLLDPQEIGGLALTTGQVGFVYGTVGLISLSLGGILGGILAARDGLKYWLWPMVCAITLPNLVFVFLSYNLPDNLLIINMAIAVEQFGYGFGFTAYMLFMIYIAEGEHKTAHYAICTGFMALGMMVPGMFSGWLQEIIGYQHFFVWVVIATVPTFIVASFIKIDPEFGRRRPEE